MADSNEEKNVEELLSQLQGIFGKLSSADDAQAREKTDLPVTPAPTPAPVAPTPKPIAAPPPAPEPAPLFPPAEDPAPLPEIIFTQPTPAFREDPFTLQPPPPIPEPLPAEPLPKLSPDAIVEVSSAPVMPAPASPQVYDDSTIGCAIYYPLMREKEAKVLAQKIETMTPKFTKLAFKLKVGFIVSYDPRADWREGAIARVRENNMRALFLLSDRVLDDAKRRAMQTDLEAHLIYFQEVPILSLEKKAFFTDVLLGMVFFFDTLKPKPSGD